jgi:VanZ family protein
LKVRWLIWLLYMGAWSVALLTPIPPGVRVQVGDYDWTFSFAKTLHVTAYAVLAVLSGWLAIPCRYRWLMALFLAAHAATTEFFQQFVDRGSSVRDVCLDLIGIALGCLVTWKWWCRP